MWIILAHSWWAHTWLQTDLGWGETLQGTTTRSCQGHVKVIWRSNKLKYWIKNIFYKLFENEILHTILGLFCQKFKIQDGRDDSHLGFDL